MTVEEVLNRYGEEFVEELKRNIVAKGGVASGAMTDPENLYAHVVQDEPGVYTLYLESTPYLKWWDSGTRPHWMPVKPLIDWVENKGIVPEERNGYLPTVEELPYMIQHKIAREGTPGHDNTVQVVADAVFIRFERQLQEALLDEVGDMLKGLPVKY